MATAAASVDAGDKECSICNELFTEPKLLPCGHLLCSHCLLSWITSTEDARCPLCRSTIVDAQSRGSRSLEQFVDSLPTDFALRNIGDAERILNKDHQCCVCEDVAATSICLTCRDTLCQFCTKAHPKLSATKHHNVQTLASLTADSLAAASSASVCDAHADKPSEVFCASHNVAICMICAATDHRQCTMVKQEAKMEEAYAVLRELIAFMGRGESEIDNAVQELNDFQKRSEQHMKSAIKNARLVYTKINALVKEGRQQLTELARTTHSANGEAAQQTKTCLLNHKGRLTLHKQSAVRAKEIKSCADLNRMTSVVKARMGDLDSSAVLQHDSRIATAKQVIGREAMSRVEQSLQKQCRQITEVVSQLNRHAAFYFHSNHGDNVTLSGDGLLAKRKGQYSGCGIVISRQPMEINHLYEIRVKSLPGKVGDMMLLLPGVVTSSPDQLTLPQHAACWSSAILITASGTNNRGKQIASSFGQQLYNLSEGSRVGVSLDASRNLQVHRDGVCLGVVTSSVPQPAHALFQLRNPWIWGYSVEALPPTRLE